jgi:hypothetical protein
VACLDQCLISVAQGYRVKFCIAANSLQSPEIVYDDDFVGTHGLISHRRLNGAKSNKAVNKLRVTADVRLRHCSQFQHVAEVIGNMWLFGSLWKVMRIAARHAVGTGTEICPSSRTQRQNRLVHLDIDLNQHEADIRSALLSHWRWVDMPPVMSPNPTLSWRGFMATPRPRD